MADDPKPVRRALDGASLIITRPSANARSLAVQARALGACVVRLPATRLCAAANPHVARAGLEQMQDADAWIFTSPAAVAFCFQLLGAGNPPRAARLLAVGAGTARALHEQGVDADFPSAAQSSAGLLDEPVLEAPQGWTIALIEAPGGSDLLADTLRERGAKVVRVDVYQRLRPWLSVRRMQYLKRAPRPWISLLSSSASLDNLLAILPSDVIAQWQKEPLIASSARIQAHARACGFEDIHPAASALDADLLAAARALLARHRM